MKKQINKKKLLTLLIVPIFCLVLVNAGIMNYFGQIKSTVDVEQPISFFVNGVDNTGEQVSETVPCEAGETCMGSNAYRIVNDGESDRIVSLITSGNTNGVDVSYVKVQTFDLYGQHYGDNLDLELSEYDVMVIPSVDEVTYVVDFPDDATEVDVEISRASGDNYHIKYSTNIGSEEEGFHYRDPSLTASDTLPIAGFESFIEGSYDSTNKVVTFTVKRELGYVQTFAVHLMGSFEDIDSFVVSSFMTKEFKTGEGGTYRDNGITYHEVIDFDTLSQVTVPANSFIEFYPQFSVDDMATDGNYVIYTTINPAE